MKKGTLLFIAIIISIIQIFAHGGGLDANGGHWDRKKGTYHYHRQVVPTTNVEPKINEDNNKQDEKKEIIVYVTNNGKKYHKLGCSYLRSSSIPIKLSEAINKYTPCSRCSPPIPSE